MPEPNTTPQPTATPAVMPVSTTAAPVKQPVTELKDMILGTLSDLEFEGSPSDTKPAMVDPEVLIAEAMFAKLDAKYKLTEGDAEAGTGDQQQQTADPTEASTDGAGPVVEAAAGDQPAQLDPNATTSNLDPDDLDDPTLPTILDISKPRGQRIYAAYKAMRQLADAPDQGGIGHVPTPDEIRSYFDSHIEIQRLINDFVDPNPDNFVQNLARTDSNALTRLAVALPRYVQQNNVQAYEHLATPIISNAIDAIINHSRTSDNEDFKQYWFGIANGLKYYLTDGKEQLDPKVLTQPIDTHAGERSELEQLRAERSQRQAQEFRSAAQEFRQTLSNDTHQSLVQTIEHTLANVKPKLSAKVYQDLVSSIYNEAKNSIITNRYAQAAIGNAQRNAGSAIGNRDHWQAHIQKITGTYMQFAKPAIAAAAKARMAEYTKTAVAAAQSAQPTVPAQTQTQRPPISRGAPAGTSPRQTQNPLFDQAGTKTGTNGSPRQPRLTNSEQTLESIYQLLM